MAQGNHSPLLGSYPEVHMVPVGRLALQAPICRLVAKTEWVQTLGKASPDLVDVGCKILVGPG